MLETLRINPDLGEAKIQVFLNISLLQSEQKDTTD